MGAANPEFIYRPDRPHKSETIASGPPVWRPGKTKCPPDLDSAARDMLLAESVPHNPARPDDPRRYAMRRRPSDGIVEMFETRFTEVSADERVVVHGFPTDRVPPHVLRRFRDTGLLAAAEYNRLLKQFG
ncbi:MAG: hypothetical protein ABI369_11720 [Acetobacteraceae bacterium]